MKDKMRFSDKEEISLPEGIAKPYIDAVMKLQTPFGNVKDYASVENVDKILSIMESYLKQYGLIQLCIELTWTDDDVVTLYINSETAKLFPFATDVNFPMIPIGRFPKYSCSGSIYGNEDFVSEAVAWGRKLYFALRDKHPLLTRDLSTGGYFPRTKHYELICEKCGMVRKKYRRCSLTEHPEKYRCSCGGKISLKEREAR